MDFLFLIIWILGLYSLRTLTLIIT